MKFSIRFADKIVGALVILAMAILVVVVFILGRNQRWFAYDYQYKTYYTSASGLSPNMPVQYMGFTIGYVKKINLVAQDGDNRNDRVEILFTVFEEYAHRVRAGSMVEIQVSPIGLGSSFNFYSGKGTELIEDGSEIPEYSSAFAKQLIASGLADRHTTGDSISNILFQVNDVLGKINNAITGPETDGHTNLEQIIIGIEEAVANIETLTQDISGQLKPIMDNINIVTEKMSDPSGSVMSFLDAEGSVYTDLTASLHSLTVTMDNIEKTSALLPSNLSVLLVDLNAALKKAQDLLTAASRLPLIKSRMPDPR